MTDFFVGFFGIMIAAIIGLKLPQVSEKLWIQILFAFGIPLGIYGVLFILALS